MIRPTVLFLLADRKKGPGVALVGEFPAFAAYMGSVASCAGNVDKFIDGA
jgi:hypothetical protein